MFKLLSLAALTLGMAVAQADELNCSEYPGNRVCNQMEASRQAYNWRCNGNACYSVWGEQLNQLERLREVIESVGYMGTAYEVGYKAFYLADAICGTTRTFHPGDALIVRLVNAENAMLNMLRDLQVQARVRPIRHCQVVVR